jgi:proteasome activator subunit 4
MLEMMGNLAVEHVAGMDNNDSHDSGVEWQDIGIFSETQWTVLIGKCLGSFS